VLLQAFYINMNTTTAVEIQEEQKAREWLSNNKEVFEKMVVAAAYASPEHLRKMDAHLCRETNRKGASIWVDEFSKPPLFALYRAIAEHAQLIRKSDVQDRRISPQQMHSFITAYASIAECISLPEVDQAMTFMRDEVAPLAVPQNFAFVDTVYAHWLIDQKQMRIMRDHARGRRDDDSRDLDERLRDVKRGLSSSTNKFKIHSFADCMIATEDNIERIRTGIYPLDSATGGGVALKEATLIIGPPGGGKTVLTCQLASNMAIAGIPTLLISTEESGDRLYPRIVSNHCNVPIGLIKDGVKAESLQPEQREKFNQLCGRLTPDVFRIVNWDDHAKDIESNFEALYEQAAKAMGRPPRAVFLDWLGGALGRNTTNDASAFRMILKRGACTMAAIAKQYNIHTITFAQASLNQCINKVRVDATMLSENKTLHEDMTNVWGLTVMLDPDANADTGAEGPVFKPEQYIYVSKSRRGVNKKIPVRTDFGYQRFVAR
jgi:replicative DNA helicase